ncbi:MAG: 30S ribosomal protein S9 [candidate division Zixibacteria bacterium]|nr:30S ribosomal protein S9 [candidate division Zixibacteria bacterium]
MQESFKAVGRRKTSTAVVNLTSGKGEIKVNGKSLEDYFRLPVVIQDVNRPLEVTEMNGKFDIDCRTKGGGFTGQSGAVRLGIARALVKYDESLKPALRKEGLLTRDPRMVERKKYGLVKSRKRFQFSKR